MVAEEEGKVHRNRSIGIGPATAFGDKPDLILLPTSARTPTEASSDSGNKLFGNKHNQKKLLPN